MVWKSQAAEIDQCTTPAKPQGDHRDRSVHHRDRKRQASTQETCNCRRSKCVKLYCACFAAARACNERCKCDKVQCGNGGLGHSRDYDSPRTPPHPQPCRCKRSRCLKRYCECFSNQRNCSDCKCVGCQNKEVPVVAETTEAADAWCKTTYKHFNWDLVTPLVQLTPEECGEMMTRSNSVGTIRLSVTRLSVRTKVFRVVGTVRERGLWGARLCMSATD